MIGGLCLRSRQYLKAYLEASATVSGDRLDSDSCIVLILRWLITRVLYFFVAVLERTSV